MCPRLAGRRYDGAMMLRERIAYHEAGHATAALQFPIPIIQVTISEDAPHMNRGHYRAPPDLGVEVMATLCLVGPASERLFCGPITDGSDQTDIHMAREYLARWFEPVRILGGAEPSPRCRRGAGENAAGARGRIQRIAASLLERGALTGEVVKRPF